MILVISCKAGGCVRWYGFGIVDVKVTYNMVL